MNLKTVVPMGAAVVLGLVAAIVARQLIAQRPQMLADGVASNINLTDVVVASRDISPGATLGEEDLTIQRVESKNAPHNVAKDPSALYHRVAKLQIPKGQIVHETLLAEAGVTGGLPGVIKPGYRAMTIEVNEFTGVAGLLQPGNHIDVLARFSDGENGQMTRTVVQNVEIIAVGTELTNKTMANSEAAPLAPDQTPQTKVFARAITVLVTPIEAERLDLAAMNQARLALRASTDTEKVTLAGTSLAALRGDAMDVPEASVKTASHSTGDDVFATGPVPTFKPRRTSSTVTVIRGGVLSEVEVDNSSKAAKDSQAGGGDLLSPANE